VQFQSETDPTTLQIRMDPGHVRVEIHGAISFAEKTERGADHPVSLVGRGEIVPCMRDGMEEVRGHHR
jgi:hypothetical protein